MTGHAQLSPSSAARWLACPGSVALCRDLPDTSSKYADEGTDAHQLAAICLTTSTDAADYVGRRMELGHVVDAEMAAHVQSYVNYVRDLGGVLMVEQRLPITSITGEPEAEGTSDAVVLLGDELVVVDLKYGMGEAVEADNNPQLMIYALAALEEFCIVQDFRTVRMVIHQPRLNSVSEWSVPISELEAFGKTVSRAATATADPDAPLNPTTKGCRWCKAKATCPALAAEALDDFEAIDPANVSTDELSYAMSKADLIEGWLKAIRAETERRLLEGRTVAGWKLVQGKRGNRAWADKAEAEALLKAMRLKHEEMYEYSVISPTTAEKLFKSNVIGPRQWPKVSALITQSDGKPAVAPASDKRPALVLDEFSPVEELA